MFGHITIIKYLMLTFFKSNFFFFPLFWELIEFSLLFSFLRDFKIIHCVFILGLVSYEFFNAWF